MDKITNKELKELKEEVLNITSGTRAKDAKIIFDGRQYSIRFPKRFIEEAHIDIKKDFFKILLEMPDYASGSKPSIMAVLERKDAEG